MQELTRKKRWENIRTLLDSEIFPLLACSQR